jgi:hypothetical protein
MTTAGQGELESTGKYVIPAHAGIQYAFESSGIAFWTPAYAGVTGGSGLVAWAVVTLSDSMLKKFAQDAATSFRGRLSRCDGAFAVKRYNPLLCKYSSPIPAVSAPV